MPEVSVASVRERSPCQACGRSPGGCGRIGCRECGIIRWKSWLLRGRGAVTGLSAMGAAGRIWRRIRRLRGVHCAVRPPVDGGGGKDEHPGGVPPQEGGVAHAPGFGGSISGRNRRVGGRAALDVAGR